MIQIKVFIINFIYFSEDHVSNRKVYARIKMISCFISRMCTFSFYDYNNTFLFLLQVSRNVLTEDVKMSH